MDLHPHQCIIDEYNLHLFEEDRPALDKAERLAIECFLDFFMEHRFSKLYEVVDTIIEDKGVLKKASGDRFRMGDMIDIATMTVMKKKPPQIGSDAVEKAKDALRKLFQLTEEPAACECYDIINKALSLLSQLSEPLAMEVPDGAPKEVWLQIGFGDEGTTTWSDHKTGEWQPEIGPYLLSALPSQKTQGGE